MIEVNEEIGYYLTDDDLQILDSYKYGKSEFEPFLRKVYQNDEERENRAVWKRDFKSMIYEWAVHNFLYSIHFKRSRTRDVDINYPCDMPEWLYKFIGCLVWIFIK